MRRLKAWMVRNEWTAYAAAVVLEMVIIVIIVNVNIWAQQVAPIKTPTGVHTTTDNGLIDRVREACAQVLRNPQAGILYVVSYTAVDTDRVCVQLADRESIRCQPVKDFRASLDAAAK